MPQRKPGPGPEDFRTLRTDGHFYIDKTALIDEIVRDPHQVVLLPRPRRFGKTLNLSTLRYFFDCSDGHDHRALFDGLAVEGADRSTLDHRANHPVIFVSFKDVKTASWDLCLDKIRTMVAQACLRHAYLADTPVVTSFDCERLERLRSERASNQDLAAWLSWLSRLLALHHGRKAVLLIDEYDAPIEAGYVHGYYDDVVELMRSMLGAGLKTNEHLYKGVLTGVQRISKDSLFSSLNNLGIFNVLDERYSDAFGFNQDDVDKILAAAGRSERSADVRIWYNGYRFGRRTVYNPWSVLSFADRGLLQSHWVATGAEDVLRGLVLGAGDIDLANHVPTLLEGGRVPVRLNDAVAFRELDTNPVAIWSLLLFAGYLTAELPPDYHTGLPVDCWIPNREVAEAWKQLFGTWLLQRLQPSTRLRELTHALLSGDGPTVQERLGELVANVLSFHDTGAGPGAPERVYHAFTLGLLSHLEPTHHVQSNPESGLGRADVLIIPRQPGGPGAVLEFKRIETTRKETHKSALATAMAQIKSRNYTARLHEYQATPIHLFAIAFSGKKVWVQCEPGGGNQ